MQKLFVSFGIAAAQMALSGVAAAADGNAGAEPRTANEPRTTTARAPVGDRRAPAEPRSSFRDWTLSAEAAVHAPLDYGAQVGFETPFGLRVYGGYGIIPSAYGDAFSSVAGSSTSDARAKAILGDLDFSGHIWRASVGIRPFQRLGLYLDVGYARADLNAGLAVDSSDIAELRDLSGGYALRSHLDLWFFELGYQARVFDRFILGLGLGMTGTLGSNTSVVALGDAPSSSLLSQVAGRIDDSFKHYGYVPTLNLRLGFDFL
ncbi:MAG TPA: hypothetical protein VEQ58_12495 [Polyangiaceae bacterium]|nr:hypothetical protein [Polyangiaceae bacterium]